MNMLANLFSSAPATPAAPAATAAPATPPAAPATPGNIPDGVAPSNPATPGTEANGMIPAPAPEGTQTPDSPLAQFSKMWEPVADAEGNVKAPAQLDATKLQEIISKADFTSTIGTDNLARIAAGGEEAQAAFTESMNSVAQQVLIQATMAANKMQEQAIKTALDSQTASIPELIRTQNASNNLQAANPLFSNPAIKPIIDAVQVQLAATNPTATPQQLTEMAQNYVTVMGEAFNPKAPTTVPGQVDTNINWESFLAGQ